MLSRLDFGCVTADKILIHFGGHALCFFPQSRGQFHHLPTVRFCIKQGSGVNLTNQHFFQCHSLRTKLKPVCVIFFAVPVFILHGQGAPCSVPSLQWNSVRVSMKFHHIAYAAQLQFPADNPHSADRQQVSPLFGLIFVVAALVFQLSIDGTDIFSSLMFQMNQCPLAAAKTKMLNAGDGQIIVGILHYCILSQ